MTDARYWHLLAGMVKVEVDVDGSRESVESATIALAGPSSRDAERPDPDTGVSIKSGIYEDGVSLSWIATWDHRPTQEEIISEYERWAAEQGYDTGAGATWRLDFGAAD